MKPSGVLLPYQIRWIEDDSPVKVAEKSRRVGLSWAEAADNTLYAARQDGGDVFYIGYNAEMARGFIDDCAFWARHYKLAAAALEQTVFNDEDQDILAFRVNFASGKTITALSSRPRNLRGKQGQVVIDEAAFHDDFDGLLKAAMALLMWGGKVRIISTHFGDDNPFNALVKDVRAGRKPYSLHRITFKDALAEGLFKRICEVNGKQWSAEAEAQYETDMRANYGDDAEEELDCIPSRGSGMYFPAALLEKCADETIPVLRLSFKPEFTQLPEAVRQAEVAAWCEENLSPLLAGLDKQRDHAFGFDFARSGDLSVFWPLAQQTNLAWRTPFMLEMSGVPFRQQEQILFYIADRLPHFRHGALDARGNGQYLAEVAMQRYGANRISQIMATQAFYLEHFPKYKAAYEDGVITIPADADIVADHRAVRLVHGIPGIPPKRNTGKDGNQRHGDSAGAGLLAWFARGQENAALTAADIHTASPRGGGYAVDGAAARGGMTAKDHYAGRDRKSGDGAFAKALAGGR